MDHHVLECESYKLTLEDLERLCKILIDIFDGFGTWFCKTSLDFSINSKPSLVVF